MRCSCCNRNLSDYEATLRHAETGEFMDICMSCLEDLEIPTIGRDDLNEYDNVEEYEPFEEENDD